MIAENSTIPPTWSWVTLDELLAEPLSNGRSVRTAAEGFPLLRLTAIRNGHVDLSERKTGAWTSEDAKPFLVRRGDFFVARGSGSRHLVGRGGLVRDEPGAVGFPDKFVRVRALRDAIESRYLALVWDSPVVSPQMQARAKTTAGIYMVTQNDIRSCRLPLAPPSEQLRIVDAAESYFSRLDDAVATLERVQANLKRYRASVLKAAVEGRLVPTEAELARAENRDYQPASMLLRRCHAPSRIRRGVPQDVPMDGVASAIHVPEGWVIQCVADLLRCGALLDVKDGNHGTNHPKRGEFSEEGLPFITAAQVGDFSIDYEDAPKISGEPLERLNVGFSEPGDVVLTHKATIGRVSVVTRPCVLTPQTTYYRVSDVIDRSYFSFHHASPVFFAQMAEVKSQTTRDYVPISAQYRLFCLIPPLAEQHRIAASVEHHLSICRRTHSLVQVQAQKLARLRQSILKWAFEGRLVDQDPADEPASALLERITAEREAVSTMRKPKRKATRKKKVKA